MAYLRQNHRRGELDAAGAQARLRRIQEVIGERRRYIEILA